LLRGHPALANARGPHGYTLLITPATPATCRSPKTWPRKLPLPIAARHFNQTLQSAVGHGYTIFVAYLLDHGVDNPNIKKFQGKTVLDVRRREEIRCRRESSPRPRRHERRFENCRAGFTPAMLGKMAGVKPALHFKPAPGPVHLGERAFLSKIAPSAKLLPAEIVAGPRPALLPF